jgi:hypothetical protein
MYNVNTGTNCTLLMTVKTVHCSKSKKLHKINKNTKLYTVNNSTNCTWLMRVQNCTLSITVQNVQC